MIQANIVLGAGVSGLTAAATLRHGGHEVLVLEKSRGLGGRAATRRWEHLPVDHGAQFLTARSDPFRAQVAAWKELGVCHEWCRGFHRHHDGALLPPEAAHHPRYVCRRGMSALGSALAEANGITIERQSKVTRVVCQDRVWTLTCEDGKSFRTHRLIVTSPPPQGADLLAGAAPEAAAFLRGMAMDPCLALAAQFPRRSIPWHGIQSGDATISWVGHDTSKRPDLHHDRTIIVVHASPAFSRTHYGEPEEKVREALLVRASEMSDEDLREPESIFLQRWRYAMPVHPPEGLPALSFDLPAPLILAGESFAGGKIEGAWLSGRAAGSLSSSA
jgi:predicted NAD/FAD-dependent oxidoreductase